MTKEELKQYQRLAEVSLRTSATTLTILFAYAFATKGIMSLMLKWFITGVSVGLFLSILFGIASLYGVSKGEIRYIKLFAIISVFLMVGALFFALMLLISVLWIPI